MFRRQVLTPEEAAAIVASVPADRLIHISDTAGPLPFFTVGPYWAQEQDGRRAAAHLSHLLRAGDGDGAGIPEGRLWRAARGLAGHLGAVAEGRASPLRSRPLPAGLPLRLLARSVAVPRLQHARRRRVEQHDGLRDGRAERAAPLAGRVREQVPHLLHAAAGVAALGPGRGGPQLRRLPQQEAGLRGPRGGQVGVVRRHVRRDAARGVQGGPARGALGPDHPPGGRVGRLAAPVGPARAARHNAGVWDPVRRSVVPLLVSV
mmetsp:Transcript_17774/g.56659  ORF Transcript_17774/g.56659 Transcript_17774/m.56659 type:complete len:262 (+) Transcript_17774:382-1167(+)